MKKILAFCSAFLIFFSSALSPILAQNLNAGVSPDTLSIALQGVNELKS
ncbi:MAG: hypothetical protein LBO09_03140 [Candidatus Peribacteria bacterium]|jgi:hypothetical protein|nr:hypothetical protein [Candidatus Peribacteria bacterium]